MKIRVCTVFNLIWKILIPNVWASGARGRRVSKHCNLNDTVLHYHFVHNQALLVGFIHAVFLNTKFSRIYINTKLRAAKIFTFEIKILKLSIAQRYEYSGIR